MNILKRFKTIFNKDIITRNKSRKIFCTQVERENEGYLNKVQTKYYYLVF